MNATRNLQLVGLFCLVLVSSWCALKCGGESAFVSGNIGLPASVELVRQSERAAYIYFACFVLAVILAAYLISMLTKNLATEALWIVRYGLGVIFVLICDVGVCWLVSTFYKV